LLNQPLPYSKPCFKDQKELQNKGEVGGALVWETPQIPVKAMY